MSSQDSKSASTSILPKACENCRIRKIRCNRADPCSNCQASGINCKPSTKPTEHRPRVLLSANYEKQIELINERLLGIEKAVKRLSLDKNQLSSPVPHDPPSTSTAGGSSTNSSGPVTDTPATFEGASSFTDQALHAGRAAELSAGNIHASTEISAALSSLRDLLQAQGPSIASNAIHFDPGSASNTFPEMQLLPAAFVVALLREYKTRPSVLFLAYAIRDKNAIDKLCQRVYFPTEPVSLGALTTMHGMLYYLIKEAILDECALSKDYDLQAYAKLVENNFHRGVETYEVVTNPTLDNAQALMLAMCKAQEESRPALCWTMVSCAARHALSLGLHRKSSVRNVSWEEAEERRHIFWTIYGFDKNLALNLGRAPNIQDYDVDIDLFTVSSDPGVVPWDQACLAFIDLGRIQGLVYEKLYSLSALNRSTEERERSISELEADFQKWHDNWNKIDDSKALVSEYWRLSFGPTDVIYYSLLTSLYRAASINTAATEITSACYEAASRSLQSHLHYFPEFTKYNEGEITCSYVSWVLLYAAFTPLIVVFMHAIASSSMEDVQLLHQVEESLSHLQNGTKEFQRVYKICNIFCRFAKAFVESNRTFAGQYNAQEDSIILPQSEAQIKDQFPMLPQNGGQFLPQEMMGQDGWISDYNNATDVSMFFGNWLGGNQPVIDLWNNIDFSEPANV